MFKMLLTLFLYSALRKVFGALFRLCVVGYFGIKLAVYAADNYNFPYALTQAIHKLDQMLPSLF